MFITAANDNFEPDELPVDIPSGKAKAREWLAEKMGSAPAITYCRYVAPPGPRKHKPRKYVAANDNQPEELPIVEALRRDGRESDIAWIMRYRTLCEVVGTSAFDSELDGREEGVNAEIRSLHLSGKNFEKPFQKAIKKGWPGTELPGGDVSYREQRQTVKQIVSVGQRINPANPETGTRTQTPLRLAKSEDERIARIDGEPILAALRAGMGNLAFILEDAVLGQWTLTKIGECMGYKHKARSREAKIVVYTAIDILRDQWRLIERQMAAASAACDRRVDARRAELAAREAAYLGLAA